MYAKRLCSEKCWMISISVILLYPFVEPGIIRSFATVIGTDYVVPSINIFILLIIIGLVAIAILKSCLTVNKANIAKYVISSMLFLIISASNNIIRIQNLKAFLFACLFILPSFFMSVLLNNYLSPREYSNLWRTFIYIFTGFLAFLLFYYFMNWRSYPIDPMLGFHRLQSPGASSVTLAYTCVLFFTLFFFLEKDINRFVWITSLILNLIIVCLSGSRLAFWLSIPTLIIILISGVKKSIYLKSTIFIGAVIILALIMPNLENRLPRLFTFSDDARMNMRDQGLESWRKESLSDKLFGAGSATKYPIQLWLSMGGTIENSMTLNAYDVIAQPHNTFIYLLVEYGIIGSILFLFPLILAIYNLAVNFKTLPISLAFKLFYSLMLFVICNMFDAMLLANPGHAMFWWFYLFFIIDFSSARFNSRDKSNQLKDSRNYHIDKNPELRRVHKSGTYLHLVN